jgi:hypothetical protein
MLGEEGRDRMEVKMEENRMEVKKEKRWREFRKEGKGCIEVTKEHSPLRLRGRRCK